MCKKLFLFFFLFGFFVLEINYQTPDFKFEKKSALVGWTQLLADPTGPELTQEYINVNWNAALSGVSRQSECVERDNHEWDTNNNNCICQEGYQKSGEDCVSTSVSASSKISSALKDTSDPCESLNLEQVENKIAKLERQEKRIVTDSSNRSLSIIEEDKLDDIEAGIDSCRRKQGYLQEEEEKEKQCKEDNQKIKEAGFGKTCAKFSRGMGCEEAITACAMCPDPDEEAELNPYNCVTVHKKMKCPLLAGEELKLAKEKRDKFQEEVKEREEELSELEKDIMDKKNELTKSLTELEEEFNETVAEFERETENAKEDLTANLNENKSAIKNEVSKQIAQVQEVVDKSLEIAHSFENAITKANMEYRLEVKKVYTECRVQAQAQLARYRNRRKQSILSGTYRVSLSSLTNKNRISFAQRDVLKVKQFYQECLVLRKSDLQDLSLIHKQKMRVIAQQKEQYQKKMGDLQKKVVSLNKMAYEQQNQLVQDYAKRMEKIILQHSKQYGLALKNYNKNKKTLLTETRKINVLEKHLVEKRQQLDQKRRELVTEQQMISYLKSKGVSEENDDGNEEFSEAAGALEDYSNAIDIAYDSCDCELVSSKTRNRRRGKDRSSKSSADNEQLPKWKRKACGNDGIKSKKRSLEEGVLEPVLRSLSPQGDR